MKCTTKEALAHAEFWAMEAMNSYDHGTKQRETLSKAYNLIKKASENEEAEAQNRALKAAQII